ncbi:hypothetical protein BCV70DRAFT_91817 [Testicularia cyperi]|uniref:Transmembrane protein n=1 Tax=Testicularia cyperi TaxID=1882483 RepID=A0A317XVC3_9BASI|nr:hypothetical protein BCV70DRAFT_91817 [Testicularia cyperi]
MHLIGSCSRFDSIWDNDRGLRPSKHTSEAHLCQSAGARRCRSHSLSLRFRGGLLYLIDDFLGRLFRSLFFVAFLFLFLLFVFGRLMMKHVRCQVVSLGTQGPTIS